MGGIEGVEGLRGWPRRGDIGRHIANSLHSTAETNTTL